MKYIRFAFEDTSMLDLRRTLFKKGLTPQQFFTYVVNLSTINDKRILEIVDEAREHMSELPSSRRNQLNADEIYSLIESEDNVT